MERRRFEIDADLYATYCATATIMPPDRGAGESKQPDPGRLPSSIITIITTIPIIITVIVFRDHHCRSTHCRLP
ncbi:hypothetical protein PHSY_003555 [Pseudozyma hubeiensis SY62]|uniref:Uncharacterized protein n=1 Tax=Pseudozyma hubeiensis (strain SY62) TaxID=1305764 RepID=R9P405_PSEHS|nr:hypothetical protein PHSY_003555 [Pseudozyma hubeiensis SY62]GAC95977.1 hypothetical protein PHSY_003555 [Pseudozyma hubeiensis SY62]